MSSATGDAYRSTPGVAWSGFTQLLELRRRPVISIALPLTVVYLIFVQYILQYGYYLGEKRSSTTFFIPLETQLQALLPVQVVQNVMQMLIPEGIAAAVVVGALALGSQYEWGTLKTILPQGPSRARIYMGTVLAIAILIALLVVALFAGALLTGACIVLLQHVPLVFPPTVTLLEGMGSAYLILLLAAAMGLMTAVLVRGSALAIGAALGWLLVFEATIEQLAGTVPGFARLVAWLPGANAQSLDALFGPVSSQQQEAYAPINAGGPQFAVVLIVYATAFLLAGAVVFNRRDVV